MCDCPKPLTEDDVRRIAADVVIAALTKTLERSRYGVTERVGDARPARG